MFCLWSSWKLAIMTSRSNWNMGSVGSKTRSQGQIIEYRGKLVNPLSIHIFGQRAVWILFLVLFEYGSCVFEIKLHPWKLDLLYSFENWYYFLLLLILFTISAVFRWAIQGCHCPLVYCSLLTSCSRFTKYLICCLQRAALPSCRTRQGKQVEKKRKTWSLSISRGKSLLNIQELISKAMPGR